MSNVRIGHNQLGSFMCYRPPVRFLSIFQPIKTSFKAWFKVSSTLLVSISPTFHKQLLCTQILKVQKDSKFVSLFYAFGIYVGKAAQRTLMKLTLCWVVVVAQIILIWTFSYFFILVQVTKDYKSDRGIFFVGNKISKNIYQFWLFFSLWSLCFDWGRRTRTEETQTHPVADHFIFVFIFPL